MIHIYYDDQVVSRTEAQSLTTGVQLLVAEVMNKKDVFAFTNHDDLKAGSDPIEVFVQVNAAKITDPARLAEQIAAAITIWKQANNFVHPVNLNVIPVTWHAKLGL